MISVVVIVFKITCIANVLILQLSYSALMISRSPLDVPFFEEEPFLGLDAKNVKVLIQAAYDEYLFIVSDWLCTEKLLWLL